MMPVLKTTTKSKRQKKENNLYICYVQVKSDKSANGMLRKMSENGEEKKRKKNNTTKRNENNTNRKARVTMT